MADANVNENEGKLAESPGDELLNNVEFVKFLAKFSGADKMDMNDTESIQKKFELFQKKERVSAGLKKLWTPEFQEKLGMKIPDEYLEGVDRKLTEEAVDQSKEEEFLKRVEVIEEFEALPAQIAEIKGRLAELGGIKRVGDETLEKTLEELDKKKTTLIDASKSNEKFGLRGVFAAVLGNFDIFKESKRIKNAVEDLRDSEGRDLDSKELKMAIDNVVSRIRSTKYDLGVKSVEIEGKNAKYSENTLKLIELELRFGELRAGILSQAKDFTEVAEGIRILVNRNFGDLLMGKFIRMQAGANGAPDVAVRENIKWEELLQAQKTADLIYSGQFEEMAGFKPVLEEYADPVVRAEDLAKKNLYGALDGKLKTKATEILVTAIDNLVIGNSPLAQTEKAIYVIIGKDRIGTMQGPALRKFFTDTLEAVITKQLNMKDAKDAQGQPLNDEDAIEEGKIKALMLRKIIAKINK